jgi:hypothetical protein
MVSFSDLFKGDDLPKGIGIGIVIGIVIGIIVIGIIIINLGGPNFFEVIVNIIKYIYSTVGSNLILFGIFIYLITISFFLKSKPSIDSQLFYVLLLIVPFLVSIFYLFGGKIIQSFTSILGDLKNIASSKTALLALLGIGVMYGLFQLSSTNIGFQTLQYASIIITILIVFVALSMFYKINQTAIYNMTGIQGFIVNFILFIPCLISDFIEYLYGEFATTPKIVYILFVIELILILLYLYLPKIMKQMNERFGKVIVDKPERINLRKDATNYIDMQSAEIPTDSQPLTGSKLTVNVRKKFAMSLWVYIVPMPTNHIPYNKEATILDFASHPRIVYDGSQRNFRIYYSASKSDQFDAPHEKWNHIFVNYDKDTVDMYLNGELKTTIPREEQTGGFFVGDILTIGQDDGLQGGIAKVVYYERPLLIHEIRNVYNYNKDLVGIE